MKKLLLLLVFAVAGSALAADMTGIITCNKCRHTDTSAASANCAQQCIRNGVPAVFIDSASNKVYKISNPDKIKGHIGQRVTVAGNVMGESLTIESLKPAHAS
jgi:hypothetical protein